MNIGIFACDPGGHTGMAWGIFDPSGDIAESLRHKMQAGNSTITGDERAQIRAVAQTWGKFYHGCVRSALLPPDHVYFVMEDFIYAPGVNYEGSSARISTAIIWGVEGYRMGRADEWDIHKRGGHSRPEMYLQPASMAMSFATNQRLKDWGIWIVGKDHERSAWRHLATFLQKYIAQH